MTDSEQAEEHLRCVWILDAGPGSAHQPPIIEVEVLFMVARGAWVMLVNQVLASPAEVSARGYFTVCPSRTLPCPGCLYVKSFIMFCGHNQVLFLLLGA